MPGHKTWAIGEEVIASDFTIVSDQIVAVYASAAARAAGWPGPPRGAVSYLSDSDRLEAFNGTAWVSVTPQSATVATGQQIGGTANTYVDLATVGPSVSVATGTRALVTLCAAANSTQQPYVHLGVAVSGATTLAPSDVYAAGPQNIAALGNVQIARTFVLTGLTPGVNVFTMKYKSSTTVISTNFGNRDLTVLGLV